MDLLGAFRAAGHLRQAVAEVARPSYAWEHDEEAFLVHFGATSEEYQEIVARMSDDQRRLLAATLDVNPEAAVLWVLAMEET